ncbi:MAG: GILT family protein, partial [Candidatus Woesearchaeota archaeon]
MSDKAKPIKKSHHEYHGVARKSTSKTWLLVSVVLAVALIISIFTNGFNFDNLKLAKNVLSKEAEKVKNNEAKVNLNSALDSLNNALDVLQKEKQSNTQNNQNNNQNTYTGKKAKLDFYVMSQCPYGVQVENAIKPVLDKLGDAVEFSVNFIATDLGNGNFQSLHGNNEVLGNIVQLCAMKYEPKKYMDLIVCMNKNANQIPTNWETCAKENSLNVDKIKTCYESDEGKQLHSESIKKSEAVNARGSPTMYLNGKQYNGGRDTNSFFRAICAELDNNPVCNELPKPKEVNLIILNDKACAECQQFNSLGEQLKSLFPGLKIKVVDFEDAEGQKLYKDLNLKFLPAFLFDKSVEEGEGYSNVQMYLEKTGDYYNLRVGAEYNPMSELCDDGKDNRDNDGLVDCQDDECKSYWKCMEKKDKPEVQLFVMSHCPFGTQMEKGILPVVELLGNKIDFKVRFVYYAMHGEVEVKEQLRQYCIQKEQQDKYLP